MNNKVLFLFCLFLRTYCVLCDLGLSEGAPCTTDGRNGTCRNIYDCATAAASYIYNKTGYFEESRKMPELCTDDNLEPIVCCTDCRPDIFKFNQNDVATPSGNIRRKNGPIAWNKCLDYFQRLPIGGGGGFKLEKDWSKSGQCHTFGISKWLATGGRDAERWEFPHMALLGYGTDQNSAQWLCGGSIISERYILTAGHCSSTPQLGPIKYAALGILKRSDPKELWNIYNIKRIIMHPEYKPPLKYNDITLLETEKEIIFSESVLPACLDVGKLCNTLDLGVAEAAGWGRLGHRASIADHLQVVEIEEYEENECANLYGVHRHLKAGYNHTTQMCYGSRSQVVNTCEGDSGGPLQVNDRKFQYAVVGVTSYGHNCGELGSAGIYTRVRHYVPWIESVVWPNETWTEPVGTIKDSSILESFAQGCEYSSRDDASKYKKST